MHVRHRAILVLMVSAAAVGVTAPSVSAGASDHSTHRLVVHPGESIQTKIDAAQPGDKVVVESGVYHESVVITTDRVSLKAEDGVTLLPPASPTGVCAAGGDVIGICVVPADLDPATFTFVHRVTGVSISGFQIKDFPAEGIFSFGSADLRVSHVRAVDNSEYGIARFNSVGGSITHSITAGSGEAGLYVGDSQPANVVVAHNVTYDNQFGVLVRHTRFATIRDNRAVGNCIGIFVIHDGQPEGAGDNTVVRNHVTTNNRSCPASADEGLPALSGGGIVLLGADDNVIRHNKVIGNDAGGTVVSGGIVLLTAPDGRGSTDNVVRGNKVRRNAPADIVVDAGSTGNIIRHNRCSTSIPAGLC